MQTQMDKSAEPKKAEKLSAYDEILKALVFYTITGYPKRTIEEIAKQCPHISANGIGTRLPEMKRKGFYIDCAFRPGTRVKEWYLTKVEK